MARTHKNNVARSIVLINSIILFIKYIFPLKSKDVRRHIIKMFEYSAINNNANIPLLYSVLNPETNSDSPSAKSNGVRFVSARFVINHIIKSGLTSIILQEVKWWEIECKSIVNNKIRILIKIRDIDTS